MNFNTKSSFILTCCLIGVYSQLDLATYLAINQRNAFNISPLTGDFNPTLSRSLMNPLLLNSQILPMMLRQGTQGQILPTQIIPNPIFSQSGIHGQLLQGQGLNGQLLAGQSFQNSLLPGQTINSQLLPGQILNGSQQLGQLINNQIVPGQLVPGQVIGNQSRIPNQATPLFPQSVRPSNQGSPLFTQEQLKNPNLKQLNSTDTINLGGMVDMFFNKQMAK